MIRSIRLRSFYSLRKGSSSFTKSLSRQLSSTGQLRRGPALATRQHDYIPPPPLSTPSQADDNSLKAHFDTPSPLFPSYSHPEGLFSYSALRTPQALRPLTDRVLIQVQAIVDRICAAQDDPSGKELRLVVKNLDRLSDLLCGVIDLCELVRNVHPEDQWIAECEKSYDRLCSFMNGLNTHVGLYEVSFCTGVISVCRK